MPGSTGPCEYCSRPGERRAGPEDGLREEAFACAHCWKLLGSPATAVPLLRGHLSLEMRGSGDPSVAERLISSFLENVSGWARRPPRS